MREVISIHIGQAGIQVRARGAPSLREKHAFMLRSPRTRACQRPHSRGEALTFAHTRRTGRQRLLGALLPGAWCANALAAPPAAVPGSILMSVI
jgi:hypothetical protein